MFGNWLCIRFWAQSITLSSSQPLSISPLILPIASADRFVPICFILLYMLFRTSFTIASESDSVVSSTSWSVVGCIVMTGSSSLSLILISPGRGCFRPDFAFPLAFVLTSPMFVVAKALKLSFIRWAVFTARTCEHAAWGIKQEHFSTGNISTVYTFPVGPKTTKHPNFSFLNPGLLSNVMHLAYISGLISDGLAFCYSLFVYFVGRLVGVSLHGFFYLFSYRQSSGLNT